MAMTADTPPSPPLNAYVASTTRRGIATWSFAIGIWSCLVFWWYPYSLFVATCGLVLGVVSLIGNWRGGYNRENLALAGVAMCLVTIVTTLTFYRGLQLFFGDLNTPIAP
jgi:hypothetical protein